MVADLPWQGRTVDLLGRGRRFRGTTITGARRIFAEGLAAVTLPKARRTGRLHNMPQNMPQSLGRALGGAPGCRLADKLAGRCEVMAATTAGRRWKVPASRHGARLWTGLPGEAMGRAKHKDVARERIAAQRDRPPGRQTVHPPPAPKGSASNIDRHRPDQHPDPGGQRDHDRLRITARTWRRAVVSTVPVSRTEMDPMTIWMRPPGTGASGMTVTGRTAGALRASSVLSG